MLKINFYVINLVKMAGNNLPTGPNEGGNNGNEQIIDQVTSQKESEIANLFQNIHRMKYNAEELELGAGMDFDKAVQLLLQKKAKGKNCFINFNGTKIYSADTNRVDDAYIQYMGITKAESDEQIRRGRESMEASERARKKREEGYAKKIADSREGLKEVKITKENVVAGLKFIAEHQDMEQDQLIDELIKLGCNFTFDDMNNQFPENKKLSQGMQDGDLGCGASVIINFMSSEHGRIYAKDHLLRGDYPYSIYAFIRKVTGDETYTKEYVDSLAKKGK